MGFIFPIYPVMFLPFIGIIPFAKHLANNALFTSTTVNGRPIVMCTFANAPSEKQKL